MTFCVSYGLGALSTWLWYRLANCWGKKIVVGLGMLLALSGILSVSLLSPELDWFLLVISVTLLYVGTSGADSIEPSLLADIIDYGTWKFGYDQSATYFAINKMASKLSMAIGGGFSLAIAGWYGFDPTNRLNTDEAVQSLYLAIAWLPAPFILIAMGLVSLISINERRLKIIRRSLEGRKTRAGVASHFQPRTSTCPRPVLQGARD